MPERAAVNELLQLGLESVLGTAVAANRQMALMEIIATAEFDPKKFGGEGRKQAGAVLPNKDWTSLKWSTKGNDGDALSYTEFVYIMSSLMGRPTPTTHAGGTNSKDWTFTPPTQGSPVNPIASYTAQQGQAAHAHQIAGFVFVGITIKGTRDGVTASGSAVAQIFQTNQVLTASPTKLATDPVLGADWTAYRDPTFGALGTTQLLRCFEWEYVYDAVFAVIWPGNKVASQNTWAALVEMDPKHTARLKIEADAQGDTGFSDVRAGTTEFYRIDCVGQLIENFQTVTITGTPTGGTFTLTYKGQTTAGIAFNANAAAVQSALGALTTVGAANVSVSGGPGPGTPYTVAFVGALAQDTSALTASGAGLTGGVSPNVTVAAVPIRREIRIDLAGKVGDKINLTDGNDLLEEEIILEVVEDTGWGNAALIVATNLLAAL